MLLDTLAPDRPSRWALASRLIDDWFPKVRGASEPGFAISDIVAAEHRLRVAFPESLREWYLKFGKLAHVWNVQDRLVSLAELQIEGNRLIIARENQDVVRWAIEVESLVHSDPPVVVSDQSDASAHHLAASSVTEFALQMLVLNAKFSDCDLFRANGQTTDDAISAIEHHLSRLPFTDLHWPPFPTRLYGDDAVFVEIDGLTWLWITAREASKFDVVVQLAESAGVGWEALERPE
jgi:hypothetical protein